MYQLTQTQRKEVLEEMLKLVPNSDGERIRDTTNKIADLYEGQDVNALGVLYRAVEKNRFDEFASRLETYHEDYGKNVPVSARPLPAGQHLGLLRTLLMQEEQIKNGERPLEDRKRYPHQIQMIVRCPEAIKMELFFADCYQDIMG